MRYIRYNDLLSCLALVFPPALTGDLLFTKQNSKPGLERYKIPAIIFVLTFPPTTISWYLLVQGATQCSSPCSAMGHHLKSTYSNST